MSEGENIHRAEFGGACASDAAVSTHAQIGGCPHSIVHVLA
jgi:hypothetical protein